MRFFIALEIPEETRQELLQVQLKLKELIPGVRLTDNGKLHLTITFIGEQPEGIKEQLTQVIRQASIGISPFMVTPSYLDGFPHMHTAHTLWIGVKGDTDKLYLLRHRIKDGLVGLNLEIDERRFIPHVAIAKVNHFKLADWQERKLQQTMLQDFSPIKVSSVKLFESIPEHGFHQHNTLVEVKLNQSHTPDQNQT